MTTHLNNLRDEIIYKPPTPKVSGPTEVVNPLKGESGALKSIQNRLEEIKEVVEEKDRSFSDQRGSGNQG